MSRVGHRQATDDSLRCSFCHKAQDVVDKLISTPTDYPRAYICDECVVVCASILEDDRVTADAVEEAVDKATPHPLLEHPMASLLMNAVVQWIRRESFGDPASEELAELRAIAARMAQHA